MHLRFIPIIVCLLQPESSVKPKDKKRLFLFGFGHLQAGQSDKLFLNK